MIKQQNKFIRRKIIFVTLLLLLSSSALQGPYNTKYGQMVGVWYHDVSYLEKNGFIQKTSVDSSFKQFGFRDNYGVFSLSINEKSDTVLGYGKWRVDQDTLKLLTREGALSSETVIIELGKSKLRTKKKITDSVFKYSNYHRIKQPFWNVDRYWE